MAEQYAQWGTTYGERFMFMNGVTLFSGTGSPEEVQSGSVGDWYFRQDAPAL